MSATRRQFLRGTAAAGVSLGLGEWAALLPISPINAAETKVTPDLVRFGPDIEPIVRLIEDTPREKCPATMNRATAQGMARHPTRLLVRTRPTPTSRNRFAKPFGIYKLHPIRNATASLPAIRLS